MLERIKKSRIGTFYCEFKSECGEFIIKYKLGESINKIIVNLILELLIKNWRFIREKLIYGDINSYNILEITWKLTLRRILIKLNHMLFFSLK